MIFFLKKLITSLILPPGCIILALVGGGVLLIKRGQRAGWLALLCGARLWRQLGVPVIFASDKHFEEDLRDLMDMGVPEADITVENTSRDTHDNAVNAAQIVRAKGYEAPILVTSDYHMARSMLLFERAGLRMLPCPCGKRERRESRA